MSEKVTAAKLSVISNSALVVLKLAVGLAIGSVSVMSEAIHSGLDLVAALKASVEAAKKRRDEAAAS
jgi:divalent metal cation (Fe/Co/Zn/Cd) transporter